AGTTKARDATTAAINVITVLRIADLSVERTNRCIGTTGFQPVDESKVEQLQVHLGKQTRELSAWEWGLRVGSSRRCRGNRPCPGSSSRSCWDRTPAPSPAATGPRSRRSR